MPWLCIRLPALAREAHAASEREALERLAAWAYQWSSLVSYQSSSSETGAADATAAATVAKAAAATAEAAAAAPTQPLLWLELGASRALFGEPAALLVQIKRELAQLGYSHVCAVAPTPSAAALLAQAGEGYCVLSRAELRAQLAALPLAWLALPSETLQALRSAGLSRIGEVLALPAAALTRRFGPQSCLYLAKLTGEANDPRPAFRLPETYRARCEFDHELQETTGLLFPLQRLLQEFQGYLRARDCAVQCFTLELEHHPRTAAAAIVRDGRAAGAGAGEDRTAPTTCVTIGLSAPAREAARFLLLVRERLQSLVLAAPVRALALAADSFTAPSIVQTDLLGSGAQQLGELSHLLDRLRARLGSECVQGFQCQADHRPERAFALITPEEAQVARRASHTTTATSPAPAAAPPASTATRPAALLPQPQRIEAPSTLLSGPERIESGWWDGAEVMRDYYVARAADGARLWVFHDLADDAWYLQGLWV